MPGVVTRSRGGGGEVRGREAGRASGGSWGCGTSSPCSAAGEEGQQPESGRRGGKGWSPLACPCSDQAPSGLLGVFRVGAGTGLGSSAGLATEQHHVLRLQAGPQLAERRSSLWPITSKSRDCVNPHLQEEPAANVHHGAQNHTISASGERDLGNSSDKHFPDHWLSYLIEHFKSMI